LYLLLQFISLFFIILPNRVVYTLGALLGLIWYYLIPIRRQVANDNILQALGLPSGKIARATYIQLARSALEILRLGILTREKVQRLVEFQGEEHLQQALENGKGAIVVTAHFGNFDLLACASSLMGYPLHVVSRVQKSKGINRFWMSIRARTGLKFISVKDSAFRIHRLLRQNQIIGMVVDQHMPPKRGIVVPFFNRPASTTHAPAILALQTGTPLIPATIHRLPAGRHRVIIEPPIAINRENTRDFEITRLTTQINSWLEEKIRQSPEHWLWIHRRWKLDDLEKPS
jgi:KDO2-lipid IV(A) lauroyltransferase